jgi:hypothetical protein
MQSHLEGPRQRNGPNHLVISADREWKTRNASSSGRLVVVFRHSFGPGPRLRCHLYMPCRPNQPCRRCLCPVYLHTCRQLLIQQVPGLSPHSVPNSSPVHLASIIFPAVCYPSLLGCVHIRANKSQTALFSRHTWTTRTQRW